MHFEWDLHTFQIAAALFFAGWGFLCLMEPASSGSEERLASGIRAIGFLMIAHLLLRLL